MLAQSSNENIQIPSWFKTNAKWWTEDKISDIEILIAIENLLSQGIIKLDSNKINVEIETPGFNTDLTPYVNEEIVPSYVKNIFVFWEKGLVSDSEVSNAIKFLIEQKIIIALPTIDKKTLQSAVIIDQLHDRIPNKYFQQRAQEYLEIGGYQVDIYTTEEITVDFYKNLPSMEYNFIVIRSHGLQEPKNDNATFLFTGEKYSSNKYIPEQLSGQLQKGAPFSVENQDSVEEAIEGLQDQMYFLVGSKLVDDLMVGKFPDSQILIGGCESVRNKDLAKSLIWRGASEIIGWDRSIGANDNDRIMLVFLEKVLLDKEKIEDVVAEINYELSPDLQYSSELHYIFRT